jgi:hypothetical protein
LARELILRCPLRIPSVPELSPRRIPSALNRALQPLILSVLIRSAIDPSLSKSLL